MVTYLDRILERHREVAATDSRPLDELIELAGQMPPTRPFAEALRSAVARGELAVIGEIKRRSPSMGELNIDRGRYGQARDAFEAVLAVDPGYLPAREGIAHLDATSGRIDRALRSYRAIVAEQPIAAYALAMADVESVAGKDAAAQRHVDLAAREIERLRASGVNADAGFVLFEANYGKPEQAVELGRQTWQEAPSVDSANAYAWALHQAGRDRAASRFSERSLRLGSADPAFLFDAGIIARAAGRTAQARRYLERVVEQSPRFSPVSGPKAERLLARLR